jgi:hypothetical protein
MSNRLIVGDLGTENGSERPRPWNESFSGLQSQRMMMSHLSKKWAGEADFWRSGSGGTFSGLALDLDRRDDQV